VSGVGDELVQSVLRLPEGGQECGEGTFEAGELVVVAASRHWRWVREVSS
jgi:hypothetical protein